MDFKVGADADLAVSVNPAGDIVFTFTDAEDLSTQAVNVAVHPAALQKALVAKLGGASWANSLVGFLIGELEALIPAAPAAT